MRNIKTWFQPETRFFRLLFKAVEEGSIFIKSSSSLIALTSVSVYIGDVKEKNQIPLSLKIKVPTMKSPLTLVKSLLAVAGVAAVSAVSAAPASAFGFGFGNIVGGDTPGDAYKNSFTFDVLNQGSSVLFKIKNSGNTAAPSMFIRQVFFDDNGYLSNAEANIGNVGTVNFEDNKGNDQLPQGGNNFTTNYAFSRKGAGNGSGIQAGDTLGVRFTGNYR